MKPFAQKICVVTGAGTGVGRSIAHEFLEMGASVYLLGRTERTLAAAAKESACPELAFPVRCDVSKPDDVERAFGHILEKSGWVDVLVNNAAAFGPTKSIEDIDFDEWSEVLATNLSGAFLCSKYVLPSMKQRGEGYLVHIGSMASDFAYTKRSPYGVTKSALEYLSRVIAAEGAPFGVRSNVIAPGSIRGERIDKVIAARARAEGVSLEEARESFCAQFKLQTMLEADDVAQEVVHLVSSEVGKKTTGEVRFVRCGFRLG